MMCFFLLVISGVFSQGNSTQLPIATDDSPHATTQNRLNEENVSQDKSKALPPYSEAVSRDNDLQIRDLAAQEEMALWSERMFWSTTAGVVVSVFGLIAVFVSLRLNRAAVKLSQDSVKIAKETLESDGRAWLSVSCAINRIYYDTTHEGVNGTYIELQVVVKNHGKSPAVRVRLNAEARLRPQNRDAELHTFGEKHQETTNLVLHSVFPDESDMYSHMVFVPFRDVLELSDGAFLPSFSIIGAVTYETANSSTTHQTIFLCHVGMNGQGILPFALPHDPEGRLLRGLELFYPPIILAK